jgi:glycine/D-amino acid oxidase-like deaminating enzyme
VRFFEEFPQRLGLRDADCGFEQNGLLLVGRDDGAGQIMANSVERMSIAQGIDTRMVTSAQAQVLHPLVETKDANLFGWEPHSGFADPYQTTTSFAAAARKLGAEIELGCTATGLEVTGGAVEGVRTSKGLVAAPIVISCLNVWTGPLLGKWLDEDLPVQPEKHSLISLRANNQPHADSSGKPYPMHGARVFLTES